MAFSHGSAARVYVNGRDLSSYLRRGEVSGARDKVKTTCFNQSAHTYIQGLLDGSVSAEGIFDGDTNRVDSILNTALGASTDSIWTVWLQGETAVGSVGRALRGVHTAYGSRAVNTDVVSCSASAQANGGPERVLSLHPLAAETSASNGTALDNSAGTTAGASAYLHVSAFSGTSVTVLVEHSTDNSSWSTLLTFTAASAAGTSERVATSSTATVNRYLRVSWSGTFSSATFSVGVSRK